MKNKTRIKVVTFKLPEKEFKRIETLSRKMGSKPGPIIRGLLRLSLLELNHSAEEMLQHYPDEVIQLIKLGALFMK